MSTIRANSVTDAAGTGSPNFPNGLSVASAALTGATLGGTTTITGGTLNWTWVASGTNLTFAYNGVNKFRIDSSGNMTVTGNVTAYGTIA
jgi:hypothetical protein